MKVTISLLFGLVKVGIDLSDLTEAMTDEPSTEAETWASYLDDEGDDLNSGWLRRIAQEESDQEDQEEE